MAVYRNHEHYIDKTAGEAIRRSDGQELLCNNK